MNWVETAIPYLKEYGNWSVFGVVFFESLGLPLPGETFLLAASLCAIQNIIDPAALVLLSILATFSANLVSYAAGYWGGRRFLSRYGKYIFITQHRIQKAEKFVKKYKSIMVIFARFIIGLRQLNGLVMGTIKMPLVEYMVLNLIGAVLWVSCIVSISFAFGRSLSSFLFNLR